MTDHDLYAHLVAHLFPNAEFCSMARLTGGVSADVYRLDMKSEDGRASSVVLRVHGATHSGHSAELEYQLLQSLHRMGLPVPEPLLVDVSGDLLPDHFLVVSFIEGTSAVPAAEAHEYIDLMAEALAMIHAQPTSGLPPLPQRKDPLPEVFDYLPAGAEWEALRLHLHQRTDAAYDGPLKLLHGDFWPENLLWRNGALAAVLDWEDAALGDVLCDVAGCRLELRYRFGESGMQRFTEAYATYQHLDAERLSLWQVYVAAAGQRFMGTWGLDPALEAHMRSEALASIREAGSILMKSG